MKTNKVLIEEAFSEGGLLDALLALQQRDGYITEPALKALADHAGMSTAELYDTASFYSMLRFTPPAPVEIRVCRGTACNSGGNVALLDAIAALTGATPGETSPDGKYHLGWVECLGQCQDAPNMLVNGRLYTRVKPEKLPEILGKGDDSAWKK